uniref:Protein phosphatase, Mg2+/Mn2+ dependent 1K n=1 Tax=Myripristis murdjan TaxID=586833 RepID=A0A667Z1B2_9TELE
MSSAVLLKLVRCGPQRKWGSVSKVDLFTPVPPVQASGAAWVRWASGAARFDTDGSGRPVTWDSFGIWDNRIEEPILLPSSIRYGKPIPQVEEGGRASVLGLRKQNEDRLRVARIHDNLLYFAVFDGHGGPHAADYCYTFMEKHIRDALEEEEDLERVLTKAFLDADKALHTHLSYFASFLTAGTTATVAMLRDGVELVVASVGDSRALLCRKGQAFKLTHDHTPDRRDERHRIQSSGGFVTWNSVGVAHVNGRLAMTRSIGDFHLKQSGVIAKPDTRRITALQYGSEDNATIIIVPLGAWGKQQSPAAVYSMSRNFASSGRWA